MSCGAEIQANALLSSLLVGEDVALPAIDFSDEKFQFPGDLINNIKSLITRLSNEDLTTGSLDGNGTFDALMRGFKSHLREEYDKGRITGADYTKAYIALTESAMSNAVQFLVNRDQAYWSAITAQLSALTARTQLEMAKMQLAGAKFDALTSKSNFGLTKLKLATEDMNYCIAKYQHEIMLPAQKLLIDEQAETQRSQTQDARSDGSPVLGSVGKQKDLYNQQIVSYQRDAEVKAAKMWTDAWITMKTIDEGLAAPDGFTNVNLDKVLQVLATANGFGVMS